jgi:hypothetical protein
MPSESSADELRDALRPLILGHSRTRDRITGHSFRATPMSLTYEQLVAAWSARRRVFNDTVG